MSPPKKLDIAAFALIVLVSLVMLLLVAVVVWSNLHGPGPRRSQTGPAGFGPGWRCENLPESTGAVMCDRDPRHPPSGGPTAVRVSPPISEPTAVP